MTVAAVFLLALLGAAVGFAGTLVGVGGGFILAPALLLLYPGDSATTLTAISLVAVFFTAASGSLAYGYQGRIDFRSGIIFTAAALPGSVVGALLVGLAPRRVFDIVMAALMVVLGAWLLVRRSAAAAVRTGGTRRVVVDRSGRGFRYRVNVRAGAAYSVVVGFVSSFLGIGGGVLNVPLMVRVLGFPVHVATATSMFVLANVAAAASITHALTGAFAGGTGVQQAFALSAGVVLGAPGGAWLSQKVRGMVLQRLLAVALVLVATRLLIGAA